MATTAPLGRDDFNIGILCALATEMDAVCLTFDEFWDEDGDPYGRAIGDSNTYIIGRIGEHNVVATILPDMGKANAAATAACLRASYANLEIVLLVGICGGVPSPSRGDNEILLGDIMISKRVIQYDFGRKYTDRFIRKDTVGNSLRRPNRDILSLFRSLQTEGGLELLATQTARHLIQLQDKSRRRSKRFRYRYPGAATDRLFKPDYLHKHRLHNCNFCNSGPDAICDDARRASCQEIGCDERQLVSRERLKAKQELEQGQDSGGHQMLRLEIGPFKINLRFTLLSTEPPESASSNPYNQVSSIMSDTSNQPIHEAFRGYQGLLLEVGPFKMNLRFTLLPIKPPESASSITEMAGDS